MKQQQLKKKKKKEKVNVIGNRILRPSVIKPLNLITKTEQEGAKNKTFHRLLARRKTHHSYTSFTAQKHD